MDIDAMTPGEFVSLLDGYGLVITDYDDLIDRLGDLFGMSIQWDAENWAVGL